MGRIFKKGTVVIGHDARLSSPILYKSLEHGLLSAGFKVIKIGVISTPMLNFFVKHYKSQGGIMVTASHNPKQYNGLKIINQKMVDIGGKDLYRKIRNLKIIYKAGNKLSKNISSEYVYKLYRDYLSDFFDVRKQIKLVIDCSNGSVGPIIKKLNFPKNVIPIILNSNPNGNFPAHGPDPTESGAINQAAKKIIESKSDCGVVFDGDGDRSVFLDNKGRVVRSEYIWRLIHSKYSSKRTTYSITEYFMMRLLVDQIDLDSKTNQTKVGHLFVKKSARQNNSDIAIESSHHYYFKEDNYSGCGMLTLIKFINSLSLLPYHMSWFVDLLPQSSRIQEINKLFNKKKLPDLYSKLEKYFKKNLLVKNNIDGLSMMGGGWWFNIRPSNTEDIIRINIEGAKNSVVRKIKNEILLLIRR